MKKTAYLLVAAGFLGLSLPSCQSGSTTQKDVLDLSGRDTSVSPAKNFFDYANGTWIKETQIPASKTGWGSFYIV